MRNSSAIVLPLLIFVSFSSFAQQQKLGTTSYPALCGELDKSITSQILPPGTYKLIPKLRPGQTVASVTVNLMETGSITMPPAQDAPDADKDVEPGNTGIVTTPIKEPEEKPSTPVGPESSCEFGLPSRTGGPSVLQLTEADLPAGAHFSDANLRGNINDPCVVNQHILFGEDPANMVEFHVSPWTGSERYFDRKHRMLATGQFNQLYIPPARPGHAMLGTQQLYVHDKTSNNKQLLMQVGNYFVEMHRPAVGGVTQQSDPISKERFEAIGKAGESRIAAVAGIPDGQMLDDNPSEFEWRGATRTVVWPVSFVNGILKVQGAGKPKWGTEWTVVDMGVKSYRGKGTGAGPVVTYTKDNKRWTVVTLNHNTGSKGNDRGFDARVSIMTVGKFGATLRVGSTCYDYSWKHLKIISCGSGNFIPGGQTNKPGTDDPKPTQDNKDPEDVTSTTGTGQNTGSGGTVIKAPLILHLSQTKPEPETWLTSPSDVDMSCPEFPTSHIKRFLPGVLILQVGWAQRFAPRTETKEIPGGFIGFVNSRTGKESNIGYFEGNEIVAENPGCQWVAFAHPNYPTTAWLIKVVPAVEDPPPINKPWSTSSEELLFGRVYVMKKAGREYLNKVRISLNRVDGRNLETQSNTGKNLAGQNEEGHYGFTGIELGRLPAGTYSIRAYKRTGALSTDLWQKKPEHRVKLPFKPGEKFTQDIELDTAGDHWEYDLNEIDKRLNQ